MGTVAFKKLPNIVGEECDDNDTWTRLYGAWVDGKRSHEFLIVDRTRAGTGCSVLRGVKPSDLKEIDDDDFLDDEDNEKSKSFWSLAGAKAYVKRELQKLT